MKLLGLILRLLCLALLVALTDSCAYRLSEGCMLARVTPIESDLAIWAGPCADGSIVAEYTSPENLRVRATYNTVTGQVSARYRTPNGWVAWDEKSGVTVGPVIDAVQAEADAIATEATSQPPGGAEVSSSAS